MLCDYLQKKITMLDIKFYLYKQFSLNERTQRFFKVLDTKKLNNSRSRKSDKKPVVIELLQKSQAAVVCGLAFFLRVSRASSSAKDER